MAVLVGKRAPDFSAPAVLADGSIIEDFTLLKNIEDKYCLLFFYPLDFTFVCPSELIAIDHRIAAFKEKNVEVIGISIDSHFTHLAWRNVPVEHGGIGKLGYTLVSDMKHSIAKAYDVESEAGVAFRGAFLIDRSNIVRSQIINDLPLGRNADELLRLFDALQFHEQYGEVCPAGWNQGDPGMQATPEGVAAYLEKHAGKL
ncbi:MAG: peroxiredoxin [Endozoicomonadaceae bacterium]|nr:peroxiredoxin [Endozoicomonadaceae bacterium]